jgi:ATP-dependent protease HslVU (ClpYQ) peptidase subunit
MTTIAFDGKTLATDSQMTAGNTAFSSTVKIFKIKGGRYLAFAGRSDMQRELIAWLEGGERPEIGEDVEIDAIVVDAKGNAVQFGASLRIMPVVVPWAGGSGAAFALTALTLGQDAVAAVEVACKLDIYSGGPVQSVRIGKRK